MAGEYDDLTSGNPLIEQQVRNNAAKDPHLYPGAVEAVKRLEREQREAAQAEAKRKENTFEAKVARGTAPEEASAKDVVKRLEMMGVNTDQMPAALDAYENAYDAFKKNKDLTPEEFKDHLKILGYHPSQIKRMLEFVDLVDPIVKADLGYSSPNEVFPDEASRRNYLVANHFSEDEIAEINKTAPTPTDAFIRRVDGTMVPAPGYKLPKDAKERIVQQYAKQARAKVKRSQAQEDEQFRIDQVEAHNAQSIPGQLREKSAEQLMQIAGNLGVEHYNRGPGEYMGESFAPESEEEKEAEAILRSTAPGDIRREEIEKLKARAERNKQSSEAAAPYMAKASRGLDEDYESRFAEKQEKNEQNLLDKMNKNYLEKIAPTIRQNYLTNNVTSHSRINEDMADTYKKLQEDNLKTMAGTSIQNQIQHLKLLAEEKQKDAGLAAQAGELAQKDLAADLNVIGAKEALNKTEENEKLAHMERLGALGMKKKAVEQDKLNLKKEEWKDKRDHLKNSAAFLADISSGNALYGVHEPNHRNLPTRNPKTFKSEMGSGLMTAGLGQFKKAGGRVHRAEGGEIDPQQAIDSAVTQGTTPSYEIGRLNNKYVSNAAGIGYLKARNAQKQAYAIGGNVNPIMAGASQAQAVVDEDAKQKAQEEAARQRYDKIREDMMRAPAEEEVSPLKKYINNFMLGAANSGTNGFLARAGRGYTAIQKDDAERAKAKSKAKGKHDDLVARLMEQHQDDFNKRANQKLHERSFGLKEREYDEGEGRRQAELDKIKAETAYHTQHAAKLKGGYTTDGVPSAEMPTRVQSEKDKDRESKTKSIVTAVRDANDSLLTVLDTSLKLEGSGPNVGRVHKYLGPTIASAFTGKGVKEDDLTNMDSHHKAVFHTQGEVEKLRGEGTGNRLALNAENANQYYPNSGKLSPENVRITLSILDKNINTLNDAISAYRSSGSAPFLIDQTIQARDAALARKDALLARQKGSGEKKSASHNVDYETSNNNSPKKPTLAELKEKEARLVKEINGGR